MRDFPTFQEFRKKQKGFKNLYLLFHILNSQKYWKHRKESFWFENIVIFIIESTIDFENPKTWEFFLLKMAITIFMAFSVWVTRGFQVCFAFYPQNKKFASEKIFVICWVSGGKMYFCSIFFFFFIDESFKVFLLAAF